MECRLFLNALLPRPGIEMVKTHATVANLFFVSRIKHEVQENYTQLVKYNADCVDQKSPPWLKEFKINIYKMISPLLSVIPEIKYFYVFFIIII